MLDRDYDVTDVTEVTETAIVHTTAAQESSDIAPGVAPRNFADLVDLFKRNNLQLPSEATTPCTLVNGQIRFGDDMKYDFGDFVLVQPLNVTKYQKVNLGIQGSPSQEQKRLLLSSYDGETVTTDEGSISKAQYLAALKKQGYEKARWEERAVIHAAYVNSDRHAKIADELRDDDILAIYCSPTSLKSLNGFLVKQAMFGNFGLLKLTKVAANANGVSWTKFGFSCVKSEAPRLAA